MQLRFTKGKRFGLETSIDGKGNFEITQVSSGIALHESKIADLDGDGDYDILGKPYGWQTPRLDIWLNQSK